MACSADRVDKYADAILSGKVLAGKPVIDACKRHRKDLKRKDIYFDKDAASHVLDFFEQVLCLGEGQFDGLPFKLDPSQAFILGSVFGWKAKKTGRRRFRRCYIEQAKGQGKSPLLAGIGLYGMVLDGEKGAQIYSAAATKEQASVIFQDAVRMAAASPLLASRITKSGRNPVWRLSHLRSESFFAMVSREAKKSGSGPRPHFVLVDELHEHPDRLMIEILERGFKFREQPLVAIATNSGSDRNSVCYEEHAHGIAVCAGEIEDDTTFAYIAALDEGDDPLEDEECWIKANPLLDVIIDKDYLRKAVAQAKAIPGRANNILRLHFCIWTEADAAWMSRASWIDCEDKEATEEAMEGRRCWLGVDLSQTSDLTSIAAVYEDGYEPDGKRRYAATVRAYIPEEGLVEKEIADHAPYKTWVKEGWLIATQGPKIRLERIVKDLVWFAENYRVEIVAYDAYWFDRVQTLLDELGVYMPLISHPQGVRKGAETPLTMPGSINAIETLILEKRIKVSPSPVLRSAVANATMYSTAGGLRRFEKNKSYGRIDAAVALTMAAGAAESEVGVRSPWDSEDWDAEEKEKET